MRIKYRALGGYKYILAEDYTVAVDIRPNEPIVTPYISLSTGGILSIRAGYAWDGPSGPAIDTRNFLRGSIVHDALYQLIRLGLLPQSTRAQADAELRRICREDGMSALRAWWVYSAVRSMGWACTRPDPCDAEKILIAP